jgi:hypothetical protein
VATAEGKDSDRFGFVHDGRRRVGFADLVNMAETSTHVFGGGTVLPIDLEPLRFEDALEDNSPVNRFTVARLANNDGTVPLVYEGLRLSATAWARKFKVRSAYRRRNVTRLSFGHLGVGYPGPYTCRANPISGGDFSQRWVEAIGMVRRVTMVAKEHHGPLSVVTATSARQFCGWTDQSGMSCPFNVRKETWNTLFLVCCDVATGLVFKHENAR